MKLNDFINSIDNRIVIYIISNRDCGLLNYSGLTSNQIKLKFEKEMRSISGLNEFNEYFSEYIVDYVGMVCDGIIIGIKQ